MSPVLVLPSGFHSTGLQATLWVELPVLIARCGVPFGSSDAGLARKSRALEVGDTAL